MMWTPSFVFGLLLVAGTGAAMAEVGNCAANSGVGYDSNMLIQKKQAFTDRTIIGEEAEDPNPVVDSVSSCFQEENQRERKQHAQVLQAEALKVAAGFFPIVSDGATAVAELTLAAMEFAHKIENLDAENCQEKAAVVILESVETVRKGVGRNGQKLDDMQNSMDDGLTDVNRNVKDVQYGMFRVYEEVQGIGEKLDDANRKIDDANRKIDDVHQSVNDVHQSVNDVHQSVNDVDQRVQDVHQSVKDMHASVHQSVSAAHLSIYDTQRIVYTVGNHLADAISDSTTALQAKLDSVLEKVEQNQKVVRQSETRLINRMNGLAQNHATLAAKLDRLSKKVVKNGESIKILAYEQVSMSFATASKEIGAAYSDFIRLVQLDAHRKDDLIKTIFKGDLQRLQAAYSASRQLRQEANKKLDDIYARATKNMRALWVALSDGALLDKHFGMLVGEAVHGRVSNMQLWGKCNAVFVDLQAGSSSKIIEAARTAIEEDDLISSVMTAVLRASAIVEVRLSSFSSPDDLEDFRTLTSDVTHMLSQVAQSFSETDKESTTGPAQLVASALSTSLPGLCPPSPGCVSAGFQAGIAATEDMVLLKLDGSVESLAVAPWNLLIESSEDWNLAPFFYKYTPPSAWVPNAVASPTFSTGAILANAYHLVQINSAWLQGVYAFSIAAYREHQNEFRPLGVGSCKSDTHLQPFVIEHSGEGPVTQDECMDFCMAVRGDVCQGILLFSSTRCIVYLDNYDEIDKIIKQLNRLSDFKWIEHDHCAPSKNLCGGRVVGSHTGVGYSTQCFRREQWLRSANRGVRDSERTLSQRRLRERRNARRNAGV